MTIDATADRDRDATMRRGTGVRTSLLPIVGPVDDLGPGGGTPEWYGAVVLAVLTLGALLAGFDDPRFVVGMVLLAVTLGLLRLRARFAPDAHRERVG
jgi:hypothetical protein